MAECSICERVKLAKEGKNSFLIHEFKSSYLVLGDHQFYKGYSLLIFKLHVRELHELSADTQQMLFKELMTAGKAVNDAFKPWKMNYSCYGNQVPHIHWHLFPRYESDANHLNTPWSNAAEFGNHPTQEADKIQGIDLIRSKLEKVNI